MQDEFIVSRTNLWDKLTDKVTLDHAVTDILLAGLGKDRHEVELQLRTGKRYRTDWYEFFIPLRKVRL